MTTKVVPYLRTEWGVQWSDGPDIAPVDSPILAREIVMDWNSKTHHPDITAKVVQRTISDWGDDD